MKIPTMLHERLLHEARVQFSVAVKRDIEVIRHRYEREGESFLTITLPVLCDALDQGLASERLSPTMFNGFKPFKRGGSLPGLFSGLFKRIFHEDGSLLPVPCIEAIRLIRMLTRLDKKVEMPCTSARQKAAFERYVSNDEGIDSTTSDYSALRLVASYVWSDLEIVSGELFCFPGVFGSGATAEKYRANERYSISEWPQRAEEYFPMSYHASHREDDSSTFERIRVLDRGDERPVRVVQVPKTLKTPRTISVEPSYMMLMQQSIAKPLMDYLEGIDFPFKSIRFTDQSVNQDLARLGSIDGKLSTIDLSDASDLVSNNLVTSIFSACPTFLGFIQSCRTRSAQMPDSSLVELKKFASMGSALCFPIESMVFFTIVMSTLARLSGRRLSHGLLRRLSKDVAIYGDDIIVPTLAAAAVIEDLESYGLKVNVNKSFTTGYFRESCGGDFYRGHDITPVYRRQWDHNCGNTRTARMLYASVSLSNQLYLKGYWHASQFIRDDVEAHLGRSLPRTRISNGGLTWCSHIYDTRLRWDSSVYSWRVKVPALKLGRIPDDIGSIPGAMLRVFGPEDHRSSRRLLLSTRSNPSRYRFLTNSNSKSISFLSSDSSDELQELYPWNRGSSINSYEYAYRKACVQASNDADRLVTSVDSYSSNMKNRWLPVQTGYWR